MEDISTSLSKKVAISIIIILLPIFLSTVLTYRANRGYMERISSNNLVVIAEAYESQVLQFFEMSKRRVRDFANDGAIREQFKNMAKGGQSDPSALNNLLKNKMAIDKTIRSIEVISMDGRVAASTMPSETGRHVLVEKFFMDKDEGQALVDNSYGTSGEPTISVSAPVKDIRTEETLGVIVNTISLKDLSRILTGGSASRQKLMKYNIDAYIVNRNKDRITESVFDKGNEAKRLIDTAPVQASYINNREMVGIYSDYRDVEVVGASMRIPELQWTLLVEVAAEEVFAPLAEMKRNAVIAGIMVAAIIAALFAMFVKRVVMPLRETYSALSNAQRIARLGNWDWDISRNRLSWSDQIYSIFGIFRKDDFGASYEAFLNSVHPDDREFVKESVNKALNEKAPYDIDHRVVLPDSTVRIVHEHGEVTFDDAGKPVRMIGTVQDVTDYRKAEAELTKLSMAIEHSVSVVFITDRNGRIEYVNPVFETVTGWSKEEAMGQSPNILTYGDASLSGYDELWNDLVDGGACQRQLKNRRKNGKPYWANEVISPIKNKKGEVTHFLAVQEDITEKRIARDKIQHLAHYDELTGMINRSRFMELFNGWIDAQTDGETGVLMIIDVDEFKYINDVYGHAIGDEMLCRIAVLLQKVLNEVPISTSTTSEGILSGRLGADEFAVFLPGMIAREGIAVAESIRERLSTLRMMDGAIHSTASIGMVLYPEHGKTAGELFTKADASIYRAKETGKNRSHLYRPEDRDLEHLQSRLRERDRIQKAINEDRFIPWFQPIVNLKTGEKSHYEALARMIDENGNIVFPGGFIDTAERFGLIGDIDRVIARKTMKMQAEMKKQGKELSFSMNLSGKNLGDEELLNFLQTTIAETGAAPDNLIFEITETAAVHDLKQAIKFISALKTTGCHFSLDDFGVGFTSFVYLREMQVDYIKIDGSFIRRLHETPMDQLFVKAINEVAKGMGIRTIAEFVETKETLDLLKEFGVDYAQGYLLGKPGPEL